MSTRRTFVDRSRTITYQLCPRKRYLEYHAAGGVGIVRSRTAIPLATGSYTHAGLKLMLEGHPVEECVQAALEGYDEAIRGRGLEIEPGMDAFQVAEEQKALVAGLLRVYYVHPRGYPDLVANYDILEVEREDLVRDFAQGIDFGARADGLLREKATGDLYVLSFKTAARWDSRVDRQNQHDVQGLSEVMAIERRLGEKLQGVKMVYLIKGDRREYPEDSGLYAQDSHLVRGWRREGITGPEYAWRYKWAGPDVWQDSGKLRGHTLGKGWERFNVWETEGGVKAWIDLLASGTVQPDAGDPFENVVVTPLPYFRQQQDMESWEIQTRAQEVKVAKDVAEINELVGDHQRVALDVCFPQYKRSCDWPSKCDYQEICYGDDSALTNPIGTGLYQLRTVNHPTEQDYLDGVGKSPSVPNCP